MTSSNINASLHTQFVKDATLNILFTIQKHYIFQYTSLDQSWAWISLNYTYENDHRMRCHYCEVTLNWFSSNMHVGLWVHKIAPPNIDYFRYYIIFVSIMHIICAKVAFFDPLTTILFNRPVGCQKWKKEKGLIY